MGISGGKRKGKIDIRDYIYDLLILYYSKCTMLANKSTGFIGFLLDKGTNAYKIYMKLCNRLSEEFGREFNLQRYPHTTMIYFGKSYERDASRLSKDMYFCNLISEFRGAKCTYERLDFIGKCIVIVYKFNRDRLISTLRDLTRRYEEKHAQYLHVTVGSLTDKAKRSFIKNKREIIGGIVDGFSFTIDEPILIRVDADKSYHVHSKLFDTALSFDTTE
jgi:hypothetical protein